MKELRKTIDQKLSRDTVRPCALCLSIDCEPKGSCIDSSESAELHLSKELGGDGDANGENK